jgi:hypothetical protein
MFTHDLRIFRRGSDDHSLHCRELSRILNLLSLLSRGALLGLSFVLRDAYPSKKVEYLGKALPIIRSISPKFVQIGQIPSHLSIIVQVTTSDILTWLERLEVKRTRAKLLESEALVIALLSRSPCL